MTDDPLVDQIVFCIGSWPRDVAGVIDFIPGFEERHGITDYLNGAGRVPAKNDRRVSSTSPPFPHFRIDGLYRDRLDPDKEVT